MLKNRTTTAITAIALGFLAALSSCTSSQQFIQPSLSQKVAAHPEYLSNLSINGPEKSLCLTSNRSVVANKANTASIGNGLRSKYAALLNVLPDAIANVSLYRFIDEWYGVRYRLGGTTKAGIDCSAFMQRLYEEVFGLNLLRTAIAQFSNVSLLATKEQCKEGDLVFFHTRGSRISHVGLYLINNFFVHASSSHGIMISSLEDSYWSKKFSCAGRVL